ncbi:PfkB family carbohydrate kinase [Sphingomonas bacterium]|uniref:PfkB family carbohydrate kinase n=1 Tax=Sphingomonas bacterium TaxID=1895847 RepID=UPI001C2CEE67|nr:PfkB family carbohydrate kinase [Sphingomonas bacterium]
MLLTLGADGAVLYEKNGKTTRQLAVATTASDTTGAGDALIGAFAASYIATGEMQTVLR